jgi:hypothetical protein
MVEERYAYGWNCQMLAFTKAPGTSVDSVPKLWPETLTAEQQAEILRQQANLRKQIRWYYPLERGMEGSKKACMMEYIKPFECVKYFTAFDFIVSDQNKPKHPIAL